MNLNPSKWFWTQYLVVIGFIIIYLVMSLTPWFYSMGIRTSTETKEEVAPYAYNEEGEPIDEQGRRINNYGQLVDEEGNPIENDEQQETKSFRAVIIDRLNQNADISNPTLSDFERTYVNGGRTSSIDFLIVGAYLFSMTYVFGMFLSSTKTAIMVNIFPAIFLLIKMIFIYGYRDVYQVAIKNVIIWWICLIIYYILFYIHDRIIITDIEE